MTGSSDGKSERRLQRLLADIADTVAVIDAAGSLIFTAGDQIGMLGYSPSEWTTDEMWGRARRAEYVHAEDQDLVWAKWKESLARPAEPITYEVRMHHASGEWVTIRTTLMNLLDDPEVGGVVLTTRDVTPLRQAERLATSQTRVLEMIARGDPLTATLDACQQLMQENSSGGIGTIHLVDDGSYERSTDAGGRADLRPAAEQRGSERSDAPERALAERVVSQGTSTIIVDAATHPDAELARPLAEAGIGSAWAIPVHDPGSDSVAGAVVMTHPRPHPDSEHEQAITEVASHLVAIALEQAATQSQLTHMALHDTLTDLPNRALLLDRLDQALGRRRRTNQPLAVLFCDLDRFKIINDSLGHGVGDQLLRACADRLRSLVQPGDTVARFGGDEFVVLMEGCIDENHAIARAGQLDHALRQPFDLSGDREVFLTVSIGMATSSDDDDPEAWLRDADAAMYRAKDRGRNRLELFDAGMRANAMRRLQIQHDLHHVVERGELLIHLQPVVDLHSGRIRGAESLVRWDHPSRGLVPPDEFIEIAEETGVIESIGAFVLDQAMEAAADLRPLLGGRPFQLAVNVSARQLDGSGLVDLIADLCEHHGWDPDDLLLEITETALTTDGDGPLATLRDLRSLGVHLAIDDFGTGYSSFSRLSDMPVDQVKIDRAFVAALDIPGHTQAPIVDAVVAIADALGLTTTAEGVETHHQLDHLRRVHCHRAQGYLISKPLPVVEFASLLETDHRW